MKRSILFLLIVLFICGCSDVKDNDTLLKEVMDNQKVLLSEDNTELNFYEFTNDNPKSYVFVDLDHDEENDLVINLKESKDIVILHKEDDTIYGYKVPKGDLENLNYDGLFKIFLNEEDYNYFGFKFNGTELIYEVIAEVHKSEKSYTLDGEKVKKKEIDSFIESLSGEVSYTNY